MDPRVRIAKEAARLLYTGVSEEYKHAKEQAAINLGINAMPSNYEVAVELDLIAEQLEGEDRKQLLFRMRNTALSLMRALVEFTPVLIGSVWRGTARKGSDVDVTVYAIRSEDVKSSLNSSGYTVKKSMEVVTTKGGRPNRSHHLIIELDNGIQVEVVVRPQEEKEEMARCEVYGDIKKGLSLPELEKLMRGDPLRKFVPKRRHK